jgi:hypothetical protein
VFAACSRQHVVSKLLKRGGAMSKSKYYVFAALILLVSAALSCINPDFGVMDDVEYLEEQRQTNEASNPLIEEFETEMAKIYGEDY